MGRASILSNGIGTYHARAPLPYPRGREYHTDSWDMVAVKGGLSRDEGRRERRGEAQI